MLLARSCDTSWYCFYTRISSLWVYFWPSVRVLCTNHEVVVFQPRTGTARDLVSVANYTFYCSPTAPPVSTDFMDIFISPCLSYRPLISSVCHRIPSLFHPLPTSSTGSKLCPPGHRPQPPPAG